MSKYVERLYNGIIKENPTLVMMLGMCPTLAVTTSTLNGIGMGLSTTVVLMFSNLSISMLRKIIPPRVRIPAFIVIVASLVTMVQLLMEGFLHSLHEALGIYIPLIVVNCIILGRAEAYASKNEPILSFLDGIGMGVGFTIGLSAIGFLRELIGAGTILGGTSLAFRVIPEEFNISIFVLAPGAFFVLSLLTAFQNKFKFPSATNTPESLNEEGECKKCMGKAKEE